ncbi:hypothetical protein M885DRAFT_567484 [Pelagophyceae sp. CCMP2097]|nr:hypothetical protein M885DRAFT_567484 [Pelagophyceae sp. CCMP2097]
MRPVASSPADIMLGPNAAAFRASALASAASSGGGVVVNAGANDGVTGDPTWPFALAGWRVLEIEGAAKYVPKLRALREKHANIDIFEGFVLPETVQGVLEDHGIPKSFAFFKIDIDSIDCVVVNATLSLGYRPMWIEMEFNPEVPPPLRFSPKYDSSANYDHRYGCYSCSLQGEVDLLRVYGYVLITASFKNAVFARRDVAEGFYAGVPLPTSVAAFQGARHKARGECTTQGRRRFCTAVRAETVDGPFSLPRPFHLCEATHATHTCAALWASDVEDARASDAARRGTALRRVDALLGHACRRTQGDLGKAGSWGAKHSTRVVGWATAHGSVPYVLDGGAGDDDAGDFARYFGIAAPPTR